MTILGETMGVIREALKLADTVKPAGDAFKEILRELTSPSHAPLHRYVVGTSARPIEEECPLPWTRVLSQ